MEKTKIALTIAVLAVEICLFKPLRKCAGKTLRQLVWVQLFGVVFFSAALLSPVTDKQRTVNVLCEAALIFGSFLYFLVLYLLRARPFHRAPEADERGVSAKGTSSLFRRNGAVLAIALITIVLHLGQMSVVQKWDSSVYYVLLMKNAETYAFPTWGWVADFRLCSHPTYGFTLWALIGEFLSSENVTGVLLVSLFLTVMVNVKIYELLRSHWVKMSNGKAFLGTLLCASIPLYWAGCGLTMPDYYMALFFICMVYADSKKDYILEFFWGFMFVFTKEVAFLLGMAFFAVKLLYQFASAKGALLERLRSVLRGNKAIWSGIGLGVAIVLYLAYSRTLPAWAQSVYYNAPMTWSGTGETIYNTFGFQADNIVTRLLQYFVVNFTWVLSLAVLICGAIRLLKGRKAQKVFSACACWECVAVIGVYGAFMCLYITACEMRYNVIFSLVFTLMCYVFLAGTLSSRALVAVGLCVSALFAGQSFRSIDFVTNSLFEPIDVGDTTMLCVAQSSHLNPGGDYYITNLQYSTIHENFKKMFQQIQLTENDTILVAGKNVPECFHALGVSELCGRRDDMKWDPEKQTYKNCFAEDADGFLVPYISSNTLWGISSFPTSDIANVQGRVKRNLNNISGRIFVYFSPLMQTEDNSELILQLEQVFDLGELQSVETRGNVLTYCELFKKDEADWQLDTTTSYRRDEQTYPMQKMYTYLRTEYVRDVQDDRQVVRAGDRIAATIECYVDGKFVNMGTSPKGVLLSEFSIGAGQVLSDFDMDLVGAAIGETVTTQCEVPENYRNWPELRGQKVTMKVTINSILSEIPLVDDSNAREYLGTATVEEYLQSVSMSD